MKLDPIERLNLTISAGAVAAGCAFASPLFATSLALGAAIEAVNFRTMMAGARRLFAGELVHGKLWMAGFALRFVVLAAAIGVALESGAHPVGLVLGLSTIVPAAIAGAWLQRPAVGPATPAPPPDDPSWDAWNPWLARDRTPADDEEQGGS